MSCDVDIVFPCSASHQAFPELLQQLRGRLREAGQLTYSERLGVLNELSDALLQAGPELSRDMPTAGLPFLIGFLRQTHLATFVARDIAKPQALERFVPTEGRKSLRLLPKGVVCHWIAGNVPLLGMFSWALSALLGNVNVIRLSTRQDDLISPLLRQLAGLSEAGRRMAEETILVCFARDDLVAHEQMSAIADVRIAWGGQDAIEAIKALPCRWECDDIVLGPRASLAVIDPEQATDGVVSRLVTDVVYFDQLACTSPQYVFVKGNPGEAAFDAFYEQFASDFTRQSRRIPRHQLDFSETYQIQLDRARILLEGDTIARDAQTQWTIACRKRPHHRVVCANRFVQVIPFEDFDQVYAAIPSNVQTVITALTASDHERFTEEASRYGVCRFPRPGEGNHFEVPWDGIPLVSRLTRWVLRSDPRL